MIAFSNRTVVQTASNGAPGVLNGQENVDFDVNVVVRFYPVQGNGSNGGQTNQIAWPDPDQLTISGTDGKPYLKPELAAFHKCSEGGLNDLAEEPVSIQVVNSQVMSMTNVPAYKDYIFNLLGANSELLRSDQFYEFEIEETLPVYWQTVPGSTMPQ